MNSQVVKTVDLSYTAPNLPNPMVPRPNLISAILQLFDSSTETVCVEGRSGYGKTTLLREFAETCTSPCFSVFFRSGSRHSYDPVLAHADLANQLNWHLDSRTLDDNSEPTEGQLRTLITRCTRSLSRRNSNAYFIVDGLYHIPDEDDALLQAIMALLPFGIKQFRFLFSSHGSKNIFGHHKTLKVKPFVLTAFTSHESDEFLSDTIDDRVVRIEHHNALGGVPALLASARRQILSLPTGQQLQSLTLPADLDAFLEAEWHILTPLTASAELLLSYILAYGRPISTENLCRYTNISEDRVEQLLRPLHFLSLSANLGGWEFASEPFRQFALNRLRARVRDATEAIATNLLEDPDSDECLALLPQYLQRIGNADKILDWFDEHRFAKILLRTRTPAWTEPVLRSAIILSHDGRSDRALMTYSILRSLVPQISNITGIDHEIRARCVLGDVSGALAVANAVPLLTQRLRLLAVYVDSASNVPGAGTQSIKDEIRDIVAQLDVDSLPEDEAIDIAVDLYPIDPPLALTLLKSTISDDQQDDSLEIAMARITVAALRSTQALDSSATTPDSAPKTAELLLDERVGKFIDATQLSLEARTSDEVLTIASDIDESSQRLFILRKWINQRPTAQDILNVVEVAVSAGIAALDFTPTATFYREVLQPLPYASSSELRSKLVAIVDAQRPVVQPKGPTIDYVRTQLLLAGCNYEDGELERTVNRLEELYLESIDGVDVLETRAACLAWCIGELERFDSDRQLRTLTQFRDLVDDQFERAVTRVLEDGADQFHILQGALEPLALFVPERAVDIASRLNTADRREQANLHIVKIICSSRFATVDYSTVFGIIDELRPGPALDKAISVLSRSLARCILELEEFPGVADEFLKRLDRCSGAATKSVCLGRIAAALSDAETTRPLLERVTRQLLHEFTLITNPRRRYAVGCDLIVQLHENCPSLSTQVFQRFSEQNEVSRVGENVEQGGYHMLDLLIKSICALSRAGLLRKEDMARIRRMISQVHNPYVRVRLLSRLAFFLWREKDTQHFIAIVNDDLWKILLVLEQGDRELLYRSWMNAYGVIWLENRDRARNAIAEFPTSVRIPAVYNLCFAILHKMPAGEPFDGRGKNTAVVIDYSDVHNLFVLCEECCDDGTIFTVLEGIADQVTHADGAAKFSKENRAEAGRIMMSIADTHLPTASGVQHRGYQIVSKAQALRVAVGKNEQWLALIASTEALANAADRAFVLALLSSYLPKRMRKERERLLSDAELCTDSLQAIEDRYNRYSTIAQIALDIDQSFATRVTEKAFRTITGFDDSRNAVREQRLLDLAYSVDPELPMKLAVLYDDDPAREQYRKRASQQIARHNLKRELGDVKRDIELRARKNDPNLAGCCLAIVGCTECWAHGCGGHDSRSRYVGLC